MAVLWNENLHLSISYFISWIVSLVLLFLLFLPFCAFYIQLFFFCADSTSCQQWEQFFLFIFLENEQLGLFCFFKLHFLSLLSLQCQPLPPSSPKWWIPVQCRSSGSCPVRLARLRASSCPTAKSPTLSSRDPSSCPITSMPTPSLTWVSI